MFHKTILKLGKHEKIQCLITHQKFITVNLF